MPGENDTFDRDASLLLYATEEMTAEQRAAFEQKLASDPELAAELAELQRAQQLAFSSISELDRQDRPAVSDAVAVRRASRAIQQWQMKRQMRPSASPDAKGLPLPWWMYPAAAAASIVVGFLVWSSRQEVPALQADDQVKRSFEFAQAEEEALADALAESFAPIEFADSALPGPHDVGVFFLMPEESSQ